MDRLVRLGWFWISTISGIVLGMLALFFTVPGANNGRLAMTPERTLALLFGYGLLAASLVVLALGRWVRWRHRQQRRT